MEARAGLSLISCQISGETENHIGHQNLKNRFIFANKTEKPDGKKGKTGNRNGQQDRENEVFQCKNRKADLQNGQN